MTSPGLCRAAAVFALAVATPGTCLAGTDEATTAHVRVRGELSRDELEAFAQLAEAAYPQWSAYFRAEPKESWLPLDLVVLKDRESFLRAVHEAGGPADLPGAGGYTWTGNLTSYLYPQPHASSTRLLVLHELTHQFQYKAVQEGRGDRSPPWHREGLAEHFGFHRRSRAGVETGVLDVVAIDDRPEQCAARVRAGRLDLWAIGTGVQTSVDYTDSLAAVETLLRTSDMSLRLAFRQWEDDVHRGANPATRFETAFRGKRDALAKAAREVWADWRRTWRIVYVGWDEVPGAIVGKGEWAVLQGTGRASSVEAEVELGVGAAGGSLVLAMSGPRDFVSADLRAGGEVILHQRADGVVRELGRVPSTGPATGRAVRLRIAVEGTDVVVSTGGLPALRVSLPSLDRSCGPGLLAEGGEVFFRSVAVGR